MNSLETAKLVALSMTAAIGIFAAGVVLTRESARRDQGLFLAGFLLLYSTFKTNDILTMSGGYTAVPLLAVVTTPVRFLLGPAVYFYARSLTSSSPQWLRRQDALALIWPAAAMVAIIPFILMSPADKNSLMAGELRTEEVREWFLLTCKIIFVLFLASAFIYLGGAFRLLLRHTRTVRDLFSNIEDKSLDWLRLMLFVLALGWTWSGTSDLWAIQGARPEWVPVATAFFELAWIGALAFLGVSQAPVFDPRTGSETTQLSSDTKYARSALSDERMQRIASSLETAMIRDQVFRDPSLSLRTLSDHLGTSEHYVSQTLNEKLGETFFDFVNRHRIAEARIRRETTDDPIVEVAHELGYNSRSTFNAAFRKYAGITPSAFRAGISARPKGRRTASLS